jgi:hypothetical protein
MLAIALGKITVATAGTPTPITLALITAAGGQLPPSNLVAGIDVCPDPGMSGTAAYVKAAASGKTIKALLKPASGNVACWCKRAPEGGNGLDPTQFAIDVATNGDGAFVTIWLE